MTPMTHHLGLVLQLNLQYWYLNNQKNRNGRIAIIDYPHDCPEVVTRMVSPIIKSDLSLRPEQLCSIAAIATELSSSSFSYNQLFHARNHISHQHFGSIQLTICPTYLPHQTVLGLCRTYIDHVWAWDNLLTIFIQYKSHAW